MSVSTHARRRLAAALLEQNSALRESIKREFSGLAQSARNDLPKYMASMEAFQADLMGAVDANDMTLTQIFGPPEDGVLSTFKRSLGFGTGGDAYDGLGSLWRHTAKDWSAEGSGLQAAMRERIQSLVHNEWTFQPSHGDGEPFRVLVPGCGQGRLAYSITSSLLDTAANGSGFEVIGLERSEATLALARHMLELPVEAEPFTFHPFLDAFTNNWDTQGRTVALSAPDVPANERRRVRESGRLVLRPDDFLAFAQRCGGPERRSDVVVTSFLLDCLSEGMEAGVCAVRDALRPGGLWIFSGPLHYFQGGQYVPRPSPTLQHILSLSEDCGMEIEVPPESIPAPYVYRPGAFLAEAQWTVPLFAARKRKLVEDESKSES